MSTYHFDNLSFHQHKISSISYFLNLLCMSIGIFINLLFCKFTVSSFRHFVNMTLHQFTILQLCQLVISSTSLLLCQLVISSTSLLLCQVVFYLHTFSSQPFPMSTCLLCHVYTVVLQFCQFAISS